MKILHTTILTSLISASVFATELLKMGDVMPHLSLTNQHDQNIEVPPDTQFVIFAADNAAATMVTEVLDTKHLDWLTQNHIIYLADIHKMPSLIAKFIALPQLREKSYSIFLGREETDLAMFPRQKGCVTLVQLQSNKLISSDFVCNDSTLKTRLAD